MKPVILPIVRPSLLALHALRAGGRSRGGAARFAYISASARRYSFGNTLTNFARARVPVVEDRERARAAGEAQVPLDQLAQQRLVGASGVAQSSLAGGGELAPRPCACSASASTGSSATIAVLQRVANVPSSS